MSENAAQNSTVAMQENASNGVGMAGFILALLALFLGWIPLLGWILWLLGALLSFVGAFNAPRGFAIAGLVISFLGVILIFLFFAGIVGLGLLGG